MTPLSDILVEETDGIRSLGPNLLAGDLRNSVDTTEGDTTDSHISEGGAVSRVCPVNADETVERGERSDGDGEGEGEFPEVHSLSPNIEPESDL